MTRKELQKWKSLENDCFEANFDASIDAKDELMGIGIIVRDWPEMISIS